MNQLKLDLRKYFIMGSQNCDRSPAEILQEAMGAGITCFQYREKGAGSLTGHDKLLLGKQLRDICRQHHVPFIINDDIDLVEPLQADGIHVGQDDLSVEKIRQQYPHLLIGLSISNEEELKKSPLHLVDYIGAGPVYPTSTKEDAKKAVGLNWIAYLRAHCPTIPIVGIGGIHTDNAKAVLEAGADGVAVISAITKATNIKKVVESLP